jgi:hypothetical protein
MKRSALSGIAMVTGGLVGLAAKHRPWNHKSSSGDTAMRKLTAYAIVPVWIASGFLDYIWHRRTHIETTSGFGESLIHSVMGAEATPVVLAPLFLEIDSDVLAWMIVLSIVHEATVLWDIWFTTPRRRIPAVEQIIHTFLEIPPFLTAAVAIATHWDEFLELLKNGPHRRPTIRFRRPPVPGSHLLAILAAGVALGGIPHLDELRRCLRARKAGLTGSDIPACLPV